MTGKYPATHPVWKLAFHSLYLGFATFFMYCHASSFDKTELFVIAEIAGAAGVIEFIKSKAGG